MHESRNSATRPLTNCSISTGRQNAVSTPCRETESGYFQLFPKTDIDATVTGSMQITYITLRARHVLGQLLLLSQEQLRSFEVK